ncbi:MAG: hypothetical protein COY38_00840 [Candidatus Aenigmarchaeota archaeon CG_4_10_14_0_8_um_filter_37_24]|nr:chemotaxis protein CheD [Candidatus Aenigmarchaeota archaeon]OIN86198.1 MAG: hypothetical protein AUJ50_03940 [Candidatus Aenigmarchaeota archaeon CG1_02_38_14]PIV69149.1 MAG: hypothetical protein COS07_01705 [Candidatus Aenigmarchaeota archaeon CG01_land_8_20_14_3_00_37_9]PIW41645.1 MAG: hypothetical protein COW21_00830 [Candidatus Aenigmarchaeota archaeon CG15_BIG_FIL_POST_REV_8_21_14_020_37_27]PIX50708.1 MAG: hypothetical protein COZ52_02880 [Candidatus Aenigmarchaeota archaeon CG_4_8_14_
MNKIELKMGESVVVKEPSDIEFKGLGNSIIVCMFEDYSRIGAMGHIMIPTQSSAYKEAPFRHGSKAIQYMVDKIENLGGIRRRIQAKIIGGAVLFKRFPEAGSNGEKIIAFVKKRLAEKKISVAAADVGGDCGRSVKFDSETGKVTVKKSNGEVLEI